MNKARPMRYILFILLVCLPIAVKGQFSFTTANGVITITGYTGSGGDVTIPDTISGLPVVSIGNSAFQFNSSLTSVTIGTNVTTIGNSAFYYCSGITNAVIGSNVSSIGNNAFSSCGIASIAIPGSVTNMGTYAFSYCRSLTNAVIGNGMTTIGVEAFYGCSQLTSVIIANSVTSINDYAFYGCTSLTNIAIPNSVMNIGNGAFFRCAGLINVIIPDSVTNIGSTALYYCTGLQSITIGTSVANIGSGAFMYCSLLTNIAIPSSVTNIGAGQFDYCTNLMAIVVDTNNPAYGSVDGVLYNQSHSRVVQCPCGKSGSYTVPDSVTDIGYGAFSGCIYITSILVANGVTNIENNAFWNCASLTNIVIGNNLSSIGANAFSGCSSLSLITIPNSVNSIGSGAFSSCGLISIFIPGGVTNIGNGAFSGCKNLIAIAVDGNNLVYTSLNGILFNQSLTTLIECPGGIGGTITIPDSVTNINISAFSGCFNLTDVIINTNVTSIGNSAFQSCTNLKSITLPNGITSIGTNVFYNCTSLTNVIIPSSVTSIKYDAFYGCSSLNTISIPRSVTNIDNYAFASCTILYSVYFYGNAPSIGGTNIFTGDYTYSGISYTRIYFAPGATGWGTTFCGLTTYAWIPTGGAGYSSFGAQIQTVYTFQSADCGAAPNASVTLGPDGNYYGTTYAGGSNYCGTIFRMEGNGRVSTILSFNYSNGANPYASLTLGNDGCLYGTTMKGGLTNTLNPTGFGTIFKVTTNGDLTTLAFFNQTNGANPWAGLAWGGDGYFYGTTTAGGITNASLVSGYGTVFRMDTNGSLTTLAMFRSTNGYAPETGLTQGIDGSFYGTTWGGTNGTGTGTLFRVTTNGAFNMLFVFGGTNGSSPSALTMGNDGNLYGTTSTMLYRLDTNAVVTILTKFGSTNKISTLTPASDTGFYGTGAKGIFRVGIDGSITNIFSFNSTNGNPKAPVVLTADGGIIGTTPDGGAYGVGTVYQFNSDGSFSTIYSFANVPGARPKGLSLGADGQIYGTTSDGGSFGGGSFYKLGIDGILKSLYSFDPYNTAGGSSAMSMGALAPTITLGNDGNFYGTTYYGGYNVVGNYSSFGTAFQITTNGTIKTLYNFNGTDGGGPYAPLTLGSDGTFYGTTLYRVVSSLSYYWTDAGKFFQITTNGSFTALYTLPSAMNYKTASLTEGTDGYFYGTSQRSGIPYYGDIYRVSTNGSFATTAYFSGTNGATPQSPLRLALDGNFYGVAYGGYTNNTYPEGMGTIYKVTTSGKITSLFRFAFTSTNGIHPVDLTMGTDGSFYGVTSGGGVSTSQFTSGMGTIFRISTNGVFTTLATFDTTTGAGPNCALIQGSDGNFYGTTYSGGITNSAYPYGMGTVFRLLLPPAVLSQPISQSKAVGATAVFQVGVTSLNQVTYHWQKNGTNLTDGGNLVGAATSMLTISDVSQDEAANYSVVVSNANFSLSSSNATLTVFLPPQGFSASIANGNQIALHLNGTMNYPYILQSATNLTPPVNWQPVLTNPADGNGNWQFTDTNLNGSQKFYRAVGQ